MRASWLAAVFLVGTQMGWAGEPVPPQQPRPVGAAPAPIAQQAEPGFNLSAAEARLAEKLAELERLQHEIDALRAEIGLRSTVIAHVVLAEVDLTRVRRLQVDLGTENLGKASLFLPSKSGESGRHVVHDARELSDLIAMLRRNGLLKVLAEPRIVAACNRPAQFDDGTTLVQFTPTSIGNEVRFDLRVRQATPAVLPAGTALPAGKEPPKLVREITTGGSLRAGKGLVLTGLTQTRTECDAAGHTTTRDVVLVGVVSIEQPLSTEPPTPLPPVAKKPERAARR